MQSMVRYGSSAGAGYTRSHRCMRSEERWPPRPIVRGTLIRLEVERLPRLTKVPVPLWLWWWGPQLPDLETIWRVYGARFSIEHTFRFFKQVLKLDDA